MKRGEGVDLKYLASAGQTSSLRQLSISGSEAQVPQYDFTSQAQLPNGLAHVHKTLTTISRHSHEF